MSDESQALKNGEMNPELVVNIEIKMDLKEYIKSLGDHLLCEESFNRDGLNEALDMVSSDIQDIRQHFREDAPPGLEPVRDFMLESLELYRQSIDDMRCYIGNEDRELLEQAIVKAEEAEDILGAIEHVIEEHRNWLNQSAEA